jgi:predicted nucleic acid-binding protein
LGFYKCVVTEQVAEKSAELRAKYKDIKLADALQLAAAIEYGCDAFFTNDKQLKQVSEINVVYLADL